MHVGRLIGRPILARAARATPDRTPTHMSPITFSVFPEHGLMVSRWVGPITDDEIIQAYRQVFERGEWRPGLDELADLREADMKSVTAAALHRLTRLVAHHLGDFDGQFRSGVVASDNLPFGIARMYEAFSESSPEMVQVFRDPAAAVEWLGAPPSVLSTLQAPES